MDDLGNRLVVNLHYGTDVNYIVDNLTNRYEKVSDANLTYNEAGNLITDKDGYQYYYDYENRIVGINDVNGVSIAEFTYDALGGRMKSIGLFLEYAGIVIGVGGGGILILVNVISDFCKGSKGQGISRSTMYRQMKKVRIIFYIGLALCLLGMFLKRFL